MILITELLRYQGAGYFEKVKTSILISKVFSLKQA